jgi:hypothetical protein
MALGKGERVKETTTTTGTGSITLAGAVTGFKTFNSVLSNGDTVYYAIVGASTEWEVGLGTFTSPSTLARTTVIDSSNAGALVNFSAGTKSVINTLPAAQALHKANNLSDVASAATAFTNLKQAATDTATGVVELATNAEAQTGSDTTRAVTPANLTAAVRKQGKETIFIPATAMDKLNSALGPAPGQFSAGSLAVNYLAFDPGTTEDAHFVIAMPKSWDEGAISGQFLWMHPSTSVSFAAYWQLFAKGYGDDDAIDGASLTTIGSAIDTGGTTSDLYISAETSSTSIGGVSEGDLVHFIVRRLGGDAADTLGVDAYLLGVKIYYTTNASTDA